MIHKLKIAIKDKIKFFRILKGEQLGFKYYKSN